MKLTVWPKKYLQGSLQGSIKVPGDKSISHRAVMFSSLAEGDAVIKNALLGEDVLSTIRCFRSMGVSIEKKTGQDKTGALFIQGQGLRALKAPTEILDCGNSGTTMRLMLGILAGQNFDATLTGDASLNKRPMQRVIQPLEQMGAKIREEKLGDGRRLIHVQGNPNLKSITYQSPVASAQVKSAVLLAGLYAEGKTRVSEPRVSRNHTENMLSAMAFKKRSLKAVLRAIDIEVPGDISSAAFFIVAALLVPGSRITLKRVGLNPTRDGIVRLLQGCGAQIDIGNLQEIHGELQGDLTISYSSLKPIQIDASWVASLIDEIPILTLLASQIQGRSAFLDVAELRVKESDRIQTMETELAKMGLSLDAEQEKFYVEGPQKLSNTQDLFSHGDHRVAMSLAIASLLCEGPSTIESVDCIQTSYPTFVEHLQSLNIKSRLES